MQQNRQLTHAQHKTSGEKFPLSIVANDISHPANVGSLFRLCDALAIKKLYLCGNTAVPPSSKINKTSRSTEKHVAYEYYQHAQTLVKDLKSSGSLIISLEITASSLTIHSADFIKTITSNKPVCLILGAENSGVNETLLSLSDVTTHIPMLGVNSSMNVITAASIACYEITRNMHTETRPKASYF